MRISTFSPNRSNSRVQRTVSQPSRFGSDPGLLHRDEAAVLALLIHAHRDAPETFPQPAAQLLKTYAPVVTVIEAAYREQARKLQSVLRETLHRPGLDFLKGSVKKTLHDAEDFEAAKGRDMGDVLIGLYRHGALIQAKCANGQPGLALNPDYAVPPLVKQFLADMPK